MATTTHPKIFVNLPVADPARSRAFFTALGWTVDEHFTDERVTRLVISDTICVMLMTRDFFASLTPRLVADPATTISSVVALWCDSRDEVDRIADAAFAGGATSHEGPEDHGSMYARSFYDLDGHAWNIFWMDAAAAAGGPPAHEAATADA